MKAITTKYRGPTDSHGARVSAKAEGVPSVSVSWDHELDVEGNHDRAALALAAKHSWSSQKGFRLARGGLPSGDGNVYVMVSPGSLVHAPRTKRSGHSRTR